jgi:hypothetical protein
MKWSVKRSLSVVLAGAVFLLFVPGTNPGHSKPDDSHSLIAKTPKAAVNTYNPVDAPDAVVAIATLSPLAPTVSAGLVRPILSFCAARLEDPLWQGRAPPLQPTIRAHMQV